MSSGVPWDYVESALREHHAIGTLDEHRTDGDTLSIRLQVPAVRPSTVEAVALSACDSAAWLFEHLAVDRVTYTLDGTEGRVSITTKREGSIATSHQTGLLERNLSNAELRPSQSATNGRDRRKERVRFICGSFSRSRPPT